MSSPRLKWLRIHRYRDVVPGTYLEFGPGFNVLLGRNGTGKTTLLELLEMIWAKGFEQVSSERFHLEYAIEWGEYHHDSVLDEPARHVPGCLIEVKAENLIPEDSQDGEVLRPRSTEPGGHLHYRVIMKTLEGAQELLVEGSPTGASLHFRDQLVPVPVLGTGSWPLVWAAPQQYFSGSLEQREGEQNSVVGDWAEWCSFFVDYLNNEGRFDESLGAFHALTAGDHSHSGSGFPGTRWECERRLDSETKVYPLNEQMCAFVPFHLVRGLMKELARDPRRDPAEFRRTLRDIPVLAAFLELTDYSDVIVEFRPNATSRQRIVERLEYRAPTFRIMLPNNRGEIPPSALSYGEKRLLSFLWYLAGKPGAVIADELVNGFHHAWIARCVELMDGRQAFLASQNPLLLDCLPFEDEESVRRCFITCRRGPETGGQMKWSNLTTEEAADFFRAYQRKTRYVHEILRSKGLW